MEDQRLEKIRNLLSLIYSLRKFSQDELLKKYFQTKETSSTEITLVEEYLSQMMQINLLLQIKGIYILRSYYRTLKQSHPTT